MSADLFHIEMLQKMIAEVMEKRYVLAFDMVEARWYEALYDTVLAYWHYSSKNLQKSSVIQNNSINLLSVVIAIIVCISLIFSII